MPTSTPTSLPTPRSTQTPLPTPAAEPLCLLSAQETISAAQVLSDVILFVGPDSALGVPAPRGPSGLFSPARGEGRARIEQLWALSPDGQQAGRLTDDRAGIGYFAPAGPPPGLLILSATPLPLPAGPLRQVALPAACGRPADLPPGADWLPCSDFRFSADGQWAAFLQGEVLCGRELGLLNLATGESQLLPGSHFTDFFQFLPSGRLLLTRGHCEGAGVYLRDIASREEVGLGGWGQPVWSPDGTALAVASGAYMGWESTVWGFDLAAERRFLAPADGPVVDNLPVWTPDGEYLLYQHRAITYSLSSWPFTTVTFAPREVRLVDVLQGQERVLLSDPAYDYHLGLRPNDCPWYGPDWLPLRRVAFRSQGYPTMDEADFYSPAIRCLLYGVDCPDPVEQMVLNWRSGEVIPASQFQIPTPLPLPIPAPTPTPSPDLGAAPLYEGLEGRYALYTGPAGQGLWCVPAAGQPIQWVRDGHHFIYIP